MHGSTSCAGRINSPNHILLALAEDSIVSGALHSRRYLLASCLYDVTKIFCNQHWLFKVISVTSCAIEE